MTIEAGPYYLDIDQRLASSTTATSAFESLVASFPEPGRVIRDVVARLGGEATVVFIEADYNGYRNVLLNVDASRTADFEVWLERTGGFRLEGNQWHQNAGAWTIAVLRDPEPPPGAPTSIVASTASDVDLASDHPCFH